MLSLVCASLASVGTVSNQKGVGLLNQLFYYNWFCFPNTQFQVFRSQTVCRWWCHTSSDKASPHFFFHTFTAAMWFSTEVLKQTNRRRRVYMKQQIHKQTCSVLLCGNSPQRTWWNTGLSVSPSQTTAGVMLHVMWPGWVVPTFG